MVRTQVLALASLLLVSCGSSSQPPDSTGAGGKDAGSLPPGIPAFCFREGDDAVRDVFCSDVPPVVGSFLDLYALFNPPHADAGASIASVPPDAVVIAMGHSTALSGHVVSAINPRVFLPGATGAFIAFQRGVQQVEIAAVQRRDTRFVNLYLVTFRQACNDAPGGCTPGDLFTPAVEKDWSGVHVRDDEDLKNTTSDCRQCHRRGTEQSMFLMREFRAPWTHFFSSPKNDNPDLLYSGLDGGLYSVLYADAKGDEPYGGVSRKSIQRTNALVLQFAVPPNQPLLFDSSAITNEHFPYVEGETWPGKGVRSATWDREYQAFERGEHLPLPYFDALVTDPEKLTLATKAYQSFRAGELAAADLPDLGKLHPDDPRTRAEMGLQVSPGATPADALIQTCAPCHNDVLDQRLTRARFNVAVSRLDRKQLDEAIARLNRPADDLSTMPPREARQLDADTRARLVEYLRGGTFPASDVEKLEHAAVAGMAGNTTSTGATYP